MNRRYQVFVSSTFIDLQDERAEALQALLELNCMPAGMELFPAANEEQWSWIKKIIDQSDYYILISAGRYGQIHPERGISYTEMEYNYAIETKKPTLAFLHENINRIESGKCETSDEGREKLAAFHTACKNRLCKFWSNPPDLAAKISRSVTQLINNEPRPGWIRADAPNPNSQLKLLQLQEENRKLRLELKAASNVLIDADKLASGADPFDIQFHCEIQEGKQNKNGHRYWVHHADEWIAHSLSWDQIFLVAIPSMLNDKTESNLSRALNEYFMEIHPREDFLKANLRISSALICQDCLNQIKMQFLALGLISLVGETRSERWKPTEKGNNLIIKLTALKKGERRAKPSLPGDEQPAETSETTEPTQ